MSTNLAKYLPKTHLVQYGETLASIASAYEGVSVAALAAANRDLVTNDANVVLEFGLQLVIPDPNATFQTHIVQHGDTLYSIVRRYDGVSVNDIVEANRDLFTNGRNTPLQVGWELKISSEPTDKVANKAQIKLHTIQPSETLFSITRQYEGVTLNQLVAANSDLLTNGSSTPLQIGWQLKIPGKQASVSPVISGRTSTPVPTAAERKVIERIRQFDSYIRDASQKFGISVEKIRAIIATESLGRADANNGHAFGLMQITPMTWQDTQRRIAELRNYEFSEANWKNPHINILFGAAVLKIKMQALGVDPSDENSAEIAVIAYNAGEVTVSRAIRYAKAGGSRNPTTDCLRPEYLKPAIKSARIYTYYLTGQGKTRNPYTNGTKPYNEDAAIDAAVDLKYKEIFSYPQKVRTYLAAQMSI